MLTLSLIHIYKLIEYELWVSDSNVSPRDTVLILSLIHILATPLPASFSVARMIGSRVPFQWTDFYPNGDYPEALMNTSFDSVSYTHLGIRFKVNKGWGSAESQPLLIYLPSSRLNLSFRRHSFPQFRYFSEA